MSATELSINLESLTAWIQREVPGLLNSGETWQITLHGGRGGDIKASIQRNCDVLPTRKGQQLLQETRR